MHGTLKFFYCNSNSIRPTFFYLIENRQCSDKYPNCGVVVGANLCRYPYYQRKCCRSCSGIWNLLRAARWLVGVFPVTI